MDTENKQKNNMLDVTMKALCSEVSTNSLAKESGFDECEIIKWKDKAKDALSKIFMPPMKIQTFDSIMEKNLLRSCSVVYDNGVALLDDASFLYDNMRYARAVSLAILAEEELSKALILKIAVLNKRWDAELYSPLRSHGHKQAISRGVGEVAVDLVRHMRQAKRSFLPIQPFPLNERVEQVKSDVSKKYISNGKLDKFKQDAQFVFIGKTGVANRTPLSISAKEAADAINETIRFKAWVDALFGNIDDDHPLLRSETILVRQPESEVITIKYKEGLDFRMSILESQDFPVKREENPCEILPSWKEREPESFDKKQKKLFCSFLEKYDGIKQMEKQLLDLGLKSSKILDACKKIVSEYSS